MNRVEFLNELEKRLKLVPKEDREDAIAYYDEYICDCGLDDNADVVAILGTPKEVAKKIIDDCTVRHATENEGKKTVKHGAATIWLAILGIAALPVSLPLVIVALAAALVLVICVIVVIIAIGVSGIAALGAGIFAVISAFTGVALGQAMINAGIGCMAIGIGILLTIGAIKLGMLQPKAIAAIVKNRRCEKER